MLYPPQVESEGLSRGVVDVSKSFLFSSDHPSCQTCPSEAICDSPRIVALPNYWGYEDERGYIRMLRCPDQYCYQRSDDCKSIHTCNTGRGGTLCGRCIGNRTQSLFSENCFLMDKCYTLLFGFLYAGCVVIYATFLGVFDEVKEKLTQRALIILKKIKNKIKSSDKSKIIIANQGIKEFRKSRLIDALLLDKCPNSPEKLATLTKDKDVQDESVTKIYKYSQLVDALLLNKCPDTLSSIGESGNKKQGKYIVTKDKADGKTDTDSGLKYVQIMFYYIQDAGLFKIPLPDAKQQTENVLVKLLQFSPEILTVYYNVSDLCFATNTTAVVKVLLSSLFGPCIALLLGLAYLVQFIFSKFICKNSQWETFRSKLTQVFLLTILFSYQKVIKGAFALIQCVDVNNRKVLNIQGDIQCYTWWQVTIEVYLYLSIVPGLITLAICPSLVKNKQMSVVMLIVACIFPVPVLLYLIIMVLIRARKSYVQVNETQNKSISMAFNQVMQLIWHITIPHRESSNVFKSNTSKSINLEHSDTISVQEKINNGMLSSERIENSKSEDVVSYILLTHYRPINCLGIPMTWLGVHKLYRMGLVACFTYIQEPLPRLSAMTVLVMVMGLATLGIKPYNDKQANKAANLSFIASILIAIINISKSSLITANYKISSAAVTTTLHYFDLCENILLTWLPVVAIVICILYSLWQRLLLKYLKKKNSKIYWK